MRKIIYHTAILAGAIALGSCVGDLDTKPLNENDFTSDVAYSTPESYKQALAKIYGSFVLVGSDSGSSDIDVGDAGASELNRAFWGLQELSTDAAKCSWVNDAWVNDINLNTWSSTRNDAIFAVYNRTMMTVTYVNEYLRQTEDDLLNQRGVDNSLYNDIQKYRAEARFIRAYAWWMALDCFGNMPFVTEDDPVEAFFPPRIERAELFDYIEAQLLALTVDPDLADSGTNLYPRVDKSAAWGLLARLYLNAEVYTGTARWDDAKNAASQAIDGSYSLAAEYNELFIGGNGDDASVRREFIFATAYDKDYTKSYGGTSFIVAAAMPSADGDGCQLIGSDGWGGIRTSYEFASTYFGVTNPDYVTGSYDAADKRALFRIQDRVEDMNDPGDIYQGWAVTKFRNTDKNGVNLGSGSYSSTDYPMIRLAEMYLIYAEATARQSGGTSSDATALDYLNALRQRAYDASDYTPLTTFNLDYIASERVRELYWESHRRTDLIRFGNYTSAQFRWPWKGGIKEGAGLASHLNLFPIPGEDLSMNPNLEQNPGY